MEDNLPSKGEVLDDGFIIETEIPTETVLETFSELGNYLAADHERASAEAAGEAEKAAYETLAASKRERAKRNRQAGAARAREVRLLKEKDNVKVA